MRLRPSRVNRSTPSYARGSAHAQYPVSQPRRYRQADRALFEHHPRQGAGVLVHRRPGRDGQKRKTPADFESQCAQVFRNVEAALKSAGASWANVVQFTTYLVHSQDIPKFMAFRLREFPKMFPNGKYPPNTLLIVDRLVKEQFLVEVQTIAAV